jgi:hypothetical protein
MSLITKIKGFLGFDKSNNGINRKKLTYYQNLPKDGRSSVDDTIADVFAKYNRFFSVLDPWVPALYLKALNKMSIIEPEFSKAVMNFQAVANTGHKIIVIAPDSKIEPAMNRINMLAEMLNIDREINDLIDQVSRNGAGSIEACINTNFAGIRKIVKVPPHAIRFLKIEGEWQPHQYLEHNIFTNYHENFLIPLNPITYRYDALQVMDNIPYGIPPMLSAVSPNLMQGEILTEISRIIKNKTLFGLNFAKVPPPPEMEEMETPEQFRSRYQEYIRQNVDALIAASKDGFIGIPSELDMQNFSTAQDVRGLDNIVERIDRRLYNGLKQDPGLLASHSTQTETYLTVIYKILVHYAENIRRIVKRSLEYIYVLDLLLGGIFVADERVSLQFNENSSIRPNIDALAERYRLMNVKDKLAMGLISPDRAAQEFGLNEFYDTDLFYKSLERQNGNQAQAYKPAYKPRTFSWNRGMQSYCIVRNTIDINSYKSKQEKEEEEAKKRAETLDRKMKKKIREYLDEMLPYYRDLQDDVIDYALEYTKNHIEELTESPEKLLEAVKEYISTNETYKNIKDKDSWLRQVSDKHTIDAGKKFFESDLTIFGDKKPKVTFVFGEGDKEAMKFYSKLNVFFFSSFIDNEDFGGSIKEFITKFLERGEASHGEWTKYAEKEFKRLFGSAINQDIDFQMNRIISTSISNIVNRSHIKQLKLAGLKKGTINGNLETGCAICKRMHKLTFSIDKAYELVEKFEQIQDIETAIKTIKASNVTLEDLEIQDEISIDELLMDGKGLAPFHPHCVCFSDGYFGE